MTEQAALHLSGTHVNALDSKGRVSVPAKLREQIAPNGEELRLTPGIDEPYLKLMPGSAWANLEAKIARISNPVERRAFRRTIIGGTHQVGLDGQGRILIPSVLREGADLRDEVMIIGDGDHVQLWSPAHWERVYQDSLDVVKGSTALLAELGF